MLVHAKAGDTKKLLTKLKMCFLYFDRHLSVFMKRQINNLIYRTGRLARWHRTSTFCCSVIVCKQASLHTFQLIPVKRLLVSAETQTYLDWCVAVVHLLKSHTLILSVARQTLWLTCNDSQMYLITFGTFYFAVPQGPQQWRLRYNSKTAGSRLNFSWRFSALMQG